MSEYVNRILEVVADDIMRGDDGLAYYWPTSNKGALSADHLRIIATELDRRNERWLEQLSKGIAG